MFRGLFFGGAVLAGVAGSGTVLPLSSPAALGVAAGGIVVALGSARAWPLVPLGLGVARATIVREREERRRLDGPGRVTGRFRVTGVLGRGFVVRVGERRVLVSEPQGLPSPGYSFTATLRLDPLRSRADPSAFRADLWAASRGLHARARVVGALEDPRPARGTVAALERGAHALRASSRRRLGFGTGVPGNLVTALLLGDRRGLETRHRDAFRRAGLAHVLALSGMHVGVLALGLASLLRALGVGRRLVVLPTLGFLAGFAFVTGAHPPILRACGTAALALGAILTGRRSRGLHALGLVGGAMLLLHPPLWLDVGARLSFLAALTLSLAASTPGSTGRTHGLVARVRGIADAIVLSAAVTLATLPVLAGSFGQVSLLSPLTNVLAGAPAAAALGWGGLASAVPGPEWLVQALARGARHAARALFELAAVGERVPGGDLPLRPLGAAGTSIVLGAGFALALGSRPSRRLVAVALGVGLAAAVTRIPRDRLTVLDVGEGDAILFESTRGAVLVDGGPPARQSASAFLPAAIARRLSHLDAAVVTHGHADHLGGIADLLPSGRVDSIIVPPRRGAPPRSLARLVANADSLGVPVHIAPRDLLDGRVVTRALRDRDGSPASADENDLSLATAWRAGGLRGLFLGDLGSAGEALLLRTGSPLAADVLLAPHHGSRESCSPALLDAVTPRLLLVSCGSGNPYGHPHAEVIERAAARGLAILRTDRDGTITLAPTRRGLRVRWQRGFPGTPRLFPSIPLFRGDGFS